MTKIHFLRNKNTDIFKNIHLIGLKLLRVSTKLECDY